MPKLPFLLFVTLGIAALFLNSCNPFSNGPGGGSEVGTNYHPGIVSEVPNFGVIGGFKVSPGNAAMRSTNLALSATVTPTNSFAVGSTVSGRFSIQQIRP